MSKKEPEQLGLIYRLILRLPKLSLESLPPVLQGTFWVIILPLVLIGQCYLNFYLLLAFRFPLNVLVVGGVVSIFLVAFYRVMLDRALNSLRMLFYPARLDKDAEQLVQEYIHLLKKKRK